MTIKHRERTFRSACTRIVRDSQIVIDFAATHLTSVKQSTHDKALEAGGAAENISTNVPTIASLPITPA